jgi:hypothetical protein
MPGLIIAAAVTSDNTPGGYILTFAGPVGLFAVVAVTLYLLFSRPHRRIPAHRILAPPRTAVPEAGAARAASIAGGLPLAAGGGATETHLEPAGAPQAAEAGPGPDDAGPDDPGQPGGGTAAAEGPEAGQ